MLNIYNQKNNNHDGSLIEDAVKIKKVHADSGRYQDVSGDFSTSQFKWSVWLVYHKVGLYKLSIVSLVILSIVFWMYSLYGIGDYLINGIQSDAILQRNLATFPNYSGVSAQYGAKPLQVNEISSFADGTQGNNLVAQVTNPNKNFIVYFDYHFVVGTDNTPVQHGFLFAGQNHPVVFYGYTGSLNGFNLVFDNLVWKRISAHQITDPLAWQDQRLNFSVSDFTFSSANSGSGVSSNQLTFKLTNSSSYSYKHASFMIGLMQGGSLAAVMPLNLDDFRSLETRNIDLRNYDNNLLANDVLVYPLIDIYDKTVYLAPEK